MMNNSVVGDLRSLLNLMRTEGAPSELYVSWQQAPRDKIYAETQDEAFQEVLFSMVTPLEFARISPLHGRGESAYCKIMDSMKGVYPYFTFLRTLLDCPRDEAYIKARMQNPCCATSMRLLGIEVADISTWARTVGVLPIIPVSPMFKKVDYLTGTDVWYSRAPQGYWLPVSIYSGWDWDSKSKILYDSEIQESAQRSRNMKLIKYFAALSRSGASC